MTSVTTLVAISLLFSASASASELPPYEPNPEFKASEILSPQQLRGPNHTVHEQVLNDGLLNYMDGLGKILQLPDWVDNETEAWYYTEIIQLMARFSESMQRPLAIVGISMVPALLTQRDELVYVLPLDYLTWNKNLAGFVKQVMAPPVEAGEGGRAFWLNGVTTQTAAVGLRTLGWSIRTGISLE